jgi:dynein heavy chain
VQVIGGSKISLFNDCRQSRLVESAVDLLLATLKGRLTSQDLCGLEDEVYRCLIPEAKQVKGSKGSRCWECMPCCYWNLVVFFNQKTIDAIVKCTRISLDFIKRYVQSSSKYMSDLSHEHAKLPLFKVKSFHISITQ